MPQRLASAHICGMACTGIILASYLCVISTWRGGTAHETASIKTSAHLGWRGAAGGRLCGLIMAVMAARNIKAIK